MQHALRLLEGEDPDTQFAEDARHWVSIYRELIAFKSTVLARVRAQSGELPEGAGDLAILEEHLDRYRTRLAFWYDKQWLMQGLVLDDESRTIIYRDRSVMLTRREHQLFMALANRIPRHVRTSELLIEAWHDGSLPEETVRTYIVRLRTKLALIGIPIAVDNRPRHGYALRFADGAPQKFTRQGVTVPTPPFDV